jgi:hypothetical protein
MEAPFTNETDRFGDFNETKSSTVKETLVQQMCYARWKFKTESCERRAIAETLCGENGYRATNTKSFGRAQISNHFQTVSPHQTTVADQKVFMVYKKWKTFVRWIETFAVDEFD